MLYYTLLSSFSIHCLSINIPLPHSLLSNTAPIVQESSSEKLRCSAAVPNASFRLWSRNPCRFPHDPISPCRLILKNAVVSPFKCFLAAVVVTSLNAVSVLFALHFRFPLRRSIQITPVTFSLCKACVSPVYAHVTHLHARRAGSPPWCEVCDDKDTLPQMSVISTSSSFMP